MSQCTATVKGRRCKNRGVGMVGMFWVCRYHVNWANRTIKKIRVTT